MGVNRQRGLFVSYKSEDANLARTVVETLKAAGVPVWFAEYEVLLANYDQFQEAIDAAIDDSRFALIVATPQWAKSRWCQVELGRILQRMPLDRILHVALISQANRTGESESDPPGEDQPSVLQQWNLLHILKGRMTQRQDLLDRREPWMEEKQPDDALPDMFDVRVSPEDWPAHGTWNWDGIARITCRLSRDPAEAVNPILRFLADRTDLLRHVPAFPPPTPVPARSWLPAWFRAAPPQEVASPAEEWRRFAVLGMEYVLDCQGWEVTSIGGTASEQGNFNGPTIRRLLAGAVCEGRLVIGEGYPSLSATSAALSALDDRQRYGHLRRFVRSFQDACRQAGQIEMDTCGLHIVQLEPNENCIQRTHAAFTIKLGGSVTPHWQRRYSIVVGHAETVFEFAFTFDFFGPFPSFLRYACLMERIVTSLRCKVL